MGIVVVVQPLARVLVGLSIDPDFGRVGRPLDARGVRASRADEHGQRCVSRMSAGRHARTLARLVGADDVTFGSPWRPWSFDDEPGELAQMDAGGWCRMLAVCDAIRNGADPADLLMRVGDRDWLFPELEPFAPSWDHVPGVAFVRGIETLQVVVLPSMIEPPCVTGGVAVVSTSDVRRFFSWVAGMMGMAPEVLLSFPPQGAPDWAWSLHCNPSIFGEALHRVERTREVIAVLG